MGCGACKHKKAARRQPQPELKIEDVPNTNTNSRKVLTPSPIVAVPAQRNSPGSKHSTDSQNTRKRERRPESKGSKRSEGDRTLSNASSIGSSDKQRSDSLRSGANTDRITKINSKSNDTVSPNNNSPSERTRKSDSHVSDDRKSTHNNGYHCPHCEHCQVGVPRSSKKQEAVWFNIRGTNGNALIDLDKYDKDVAFEKSLTEYGHITDCYYHPPQLNIRNTRNSDKNEKKLVTEPVLAITNPNIRRNHTPFPDYDRLASDDFRLNKPYGHSLFND